jgi:hypothetical protein
VVVDGTLIPIDRIAADRPFCSGKHKMHGEPASDRIPGRHDPYKGRTKSESQKDANRAHARLRGPGERANTRLKTRRILRTLRCCPPPRRTTGQSHSRVTELRDHRRMKKARY